MNYIKHLNQWMELSSIDDRLTSHHISIYMALFQFWNRNRFPDTLFICRNEIMQVGKVGSTRTYYKCINQLHEFGYIVYTPSKCPMKGSTISINLLDGLSFNIENSSPDNDDENPEEDPFESPTSTHVEHEQNRYSYGCKNDTSGNLEVTPLLKHNINLLNYKQRERRTPATGELDNFSFLNQKGKSVQKSKSLVKEKSSEGPQKLWSASCASSGNSLERKKIVPREISIPTLDQVQDFFMHQLSGSYLTSVLETKDREIEAEKFFNHYEANGWMLGGKVPMRSWKAACRSWVAKIPYFTKRDVKRSNFNRLHANPMVDYAKPL